MRRSHLLTVAATVVAATVIATVGARVPLAQAAGGPNLSLGKATSASTSNGPHGAGNLNDANPGTYWESANDAFPQWAGIDLGGSTSIDQVVLRLPAGWEARSQTLSVGAWVGRDFSDTPAYWNPGDGIEFTGMRIRDTYADGINFANSTRNSRVFNSSFRTTGDDSLAVWSSTFVRDQATDIGHDNHFVNNTIQLPWRANGVAIYGGFGNTIENNLIYDTMNYPGIMLATDHSPQPSRGRR
jgi:hypothetical protein